MKTGTICWTDLTVKNADEIRDFYESVIGWRSEPHDMEEYHDYNMISPVTGECVTGICHARGTNANVPPQWLVYFLVDDVEASAKKCVERGNRGWAANDGQGRVLRDPRPGGRGMRTL